MATNTTEASGAGQQVLFLLGKTGHGKSSTGNTILGRHAFQTSDDSESQTFITQSGWTRIGQDVVQVVDGPGVCETRLSRGEAAEKMVNDMSRGLLLCPDGFDALVLVCRYGIRFTEEEVQTVQALKAVFGPRFINDFGILVFTHGEQLDMKNRKNRQTQSFEEWLAIQKGPVRSLIDECENRCVLFRNMEGDETQVGLLLDTVKQLQMRGVRYTKDMFQEIKDEQEKFCARENASVFRAEIQKKFGLLQDGLNRIINLTETCRDVVRIEGEFDMLLFDASNLKKEIESLDKGTGVLTHLKDNIESLEQTIQLRKSMLKDVQHQDELDRQLLELREQLCQSERELEESKQRAQEDSKGDYVKAIATISKIVLAALPVIIKYVKAIWTDDEQGAICAGPIIREVLSSDSE